MEPSHAEITSLLEKLEKFGKLDDFSKGNLLSKDAALRTAIGDLVIPDKKRKSKSEEEKEQARLEKKRKEEEKEAKAKAAWLQEQSDRENLKFVAKYVAAKETALANYAKYKAASGVVTMGVAHDLASKMPDEVVDGDPVAIARVRELLVAGLTGANGAEQYALAQNMHLYSAWAKIKATHQAARQAAITPSKRKPTKTTWEQYFHQIAKGTEYEFMPLSTMSNHIGAAKILMLYPLLKWAGFSWSTFCQEHAKIHALFTGNPQLHAFWKELPDGDKTASTKYAVSSGTQTLAVGKHETKVLTDHEMSEVDCQYKSLQFAFEEDELFPGETPIDMKMRLASFEIESETLTVDEWLESVFRDGLNAESELVIMNEWRKRNKLEPLPLPDRFRGPPRAGGPASSSAPPARPVTQKDVDELQAKVADIETRRKAAEAKEAAAKAQHGDKMDQS